MGRKLLRFFLQILAPELNDRMLAIFCPWTTAW